MERFITDPENYTFNDLQNNDWDVVKLNIRFDNNQMKQWYDEIAEKNADEALDLSVEGFEKMKVIYNKENLDLIETFYKNTTLGNGKQWTLQWSHQRRGVTPFIRLANPELFPEVEDPDFVKKANENLEQYYFGFYKKYIDLLGTDVFETNRIINFPNSSGIQTHTDIDEEHYLIRMHSQIQTSDNCYWIFGKPADETRKYPMEAGCVYLYNTGVPHAAFNYGTADWLMLHNNPTDESIDKLLSSNFYVD